MLKIIYRTLIFSLFLNFSFNLPAGDQKQIYVARIDSSPKMDGLLDDKVWENVPVSSDFRMIIPETGKDPSEKTELKIAYNDKYLYIGIKCYSSDPKKISVNTLKYDQHGRWSNGDDIVRILIDPFLDMRNAYVFIVNPKGARTDGLASGEHFSSNWDGIWDVVTSINRDSWSAEIEIPFKTLTFNSGIKKWGINVERYIARKMETIRLSGISKDSFFYNPSIAARAGDFIGLKQGLGLTFKPYMILSAEKILSDGKERQWNLDGGFDLYKNFTSNLVGVFTYNTDFAETEVDERRINLTRFSLYFPEKRSFFLEGSDIFSFGSGLHRTFVPFFSRTIGIYNEEYIVPIDYGMKVFGKVGKTNLALLNVKTRDSEWIPGNSFIAGRVYQNIFAQSKAGMIFTKGNPDSLEDNSMLGFDFNFSTSEFLKNKNFMAGGWWVYNWNSINEGKHYGYGLKIDYPNDLWDIAFTYNYFGDALEPGLAYLPRNNVQIIRPSIVFKPRPENGLIGKLIRQFYFEFFSSIYLDLDGNVISSRIFTAPINFRTESGDHFEFNIIPEKEVLDEPFELSDKIIFPAAEYSQTRFRAQFHSASHRKIDLAMNYTFGGFYSGNLSELKIGSSYKHGGNFKADVSVLFLRGDFPEGKYSKNLFRLSSDFFLNPDMGLIGLLQFDDDSNEMGINLRFKWRISPGNIIYLVYNKNWERVWDPSARFQMINDLGIFKLQFSIRP
ncbi:MAG: carbohydrate binding family 9 domain-containing protein [Candidatus Aminicenantes bacterium]|nr:carbohydrate binding family 9 domain-containing protein [Candidatus Aminicenantes bacterium]